MKFQNSIAFLSLLTICLSAGCMPRDAMNDPSPRELGAESAPGGSTFGAIEMWKTENATCDIKGNTANWQAAYCMWLHQSESFDKSEVEECFDMISKRPGIPTQPCARNQYFKREICKSLAVDGYFHRSVEQCLHSDAAVPLAVREGLE